MAKQTIETVTFKLNAGVKPEAFIAAAEAANRWITAQRGFVARRLSRAEDGVWTDHIQWEDLEAAQSAAAQIGAAPELADFLGAIDGPTVLLQHATLEVAVN